MRRDGFGDEYISSDDRSFADDRFSAENGCAGIDGNIVFNGRMSFFAGKLLAAAGRKRAEGHALIDLYIVSDDGCFSDDDAGSVVDKEVFADYRAGVDVNSGHAVGVFCHDPWNKGNVLLVKLMGDAVNIGSKKTGIGENDFFFTFCRGVSVKTGLYVFEKQRFYAGQFPEKTDAYFFGFLFGFVFYGVIFIKKRGENLFVQFFEQQADTVSRIIIGGLFFGPCLAEIAGENNLAEAVDDFDNRRAVRQGIGLLLGK